MFRKLSAIFCCFTLCISFWGFAPAGEDCAKATLLMDYHTGQVLSEHNSKAHLPIASVTKLTTLLLCFEALEKGELSLDEELLASQHASSMGGSQVFIDENSSYNVLALLHAVAIASANDASVVLAERIAGSEDAFVSLMNDRVLALGGQDTHYTNCTGLPSPNAFSCAFDVALVMREVLNYPLYFEISQIRLEDFSHPSGRQTQMSNTNKLLSRYAFCDGGKTGSTSEAKFCMCATAHKSDMRLISVVLGADSSSLRFDQCVSMFDWGFNNFVSTRLLNSDDVLDVPVRLAKNMAQCSPNRSYYVTTLKGEDTPYSVDYSFCSLVAPLSKGDIVGKAIISNNGIVCAEIDLVLLDNVSELSVTDLFRAISREF